MQKNEKQKLKNKIQKVLEVYCPALDESSKQLYFEWGLWERRSYRKDKAESLFRSLLDYDNRHIPAHTELGKLLAQRGENQDAEQLFRQAIELDCSELHARFEWALLYKKNGEYKKALDKLDEILTLDPNNKYALCEKPKILSLLHLN